MNNYTFRSRLGLGPKLLYILLLLLTLSSAASAEELRVLSYNMWTGLDYKGTLKMGEYENADRRQARYDLMIEEIRRLDPDIIALNEVNYLPRTVSNLKKDLDMHSVVSPVNAGLKIFGLGIPVNLRDGDIILAKKHLNLKKIARKKLSGDAYGVHSRLFTFHLNESQFSLLGSVDIGEKTIYLVNNHLHASILQTNAVHDLTKKAEETEEYSLEEIQTLRTQLQSGEDRRNREGRSMLDFLDSELDEQVPIILMGDYNDTPNSRLYEQILNRGYLDSYAMLNGSDRPGYTWDSKENSNINPMQIERFVGASALYDKVNHLDYMNRTRIDYIFIRNMAPEAVLESRVVLNTAKNGLFPSDHFGVFTVIDIK